MKLTIEVTKEHMQCDSRSGFSCPIHHALFPKLNLVSQKQLHVGVWDITITTVNFGEVKIDLPDIATDFITRYDATNSLEEIDSIEPFNFDIDIPDKFVK